MSCRQLVTTFVDGRRNTRHMDVPALEAIERALAEYWGPFLVVSHDRYFIERIGINRVEVIDGGRLRALEDMAGYERQAATTLTAGRSRSPSPS